MGVYKDKKRGTWYVSYSVKDPVTNKFLHKTKRGFESSRAAKAWERENRSDTGSEAPTTFRDVAKIWEEYLQSSEGSRRQHKEHFEIRFSKFLDRPINEISRAELIKWRASLASADYATKTKNTTLSYVRSVFKFAAESYGLRNPAAVLTNLKKTDDEILEEPEVWTPVEFDQFLKYVEDPLYKTFFEFLFWTGCRRGEAIALQKKDVKNHSVIIKYSQRTTAKGLTPTKTKNKRQIQLDDVLWEHLRPLILMDGDYVFGGYVGLAPTSIDRVFKKAVKQSGVKNIRLHDLRHSHATWLINNGVNIVAVSKRLGHTTIEQTLRTYTHLLESSDQNMMLKMNGFRENRETKRETNVPNKPLEPIIKSPNSRYSSSGCQIRVPAPDND